jgi:hypothetical protein
MSYRISVMSRFMASLAVTLMTAPGCNNSGPTAPRSAVVPTPGAQAPVEGALAGTFAGTYASYYTGPGGCTNTVAATFTATGNRVTGHLQTTGAACGFQQIVFEGTFQETNRFYGNLTGRITGEPFVNGSATGYVTASAADDGPRIRLALSDGPAGVGAVTLVRTGT